MQNDPLTHATDASPTPYRNAGSLRQDLPFHCCAGSGPTTTQNEAFAHDTDSRPDAGGVLSSRHVVPFHSCAAPSPTAMQNEELGQDTEVRPVLAAELRMTCHLLPFHRSARDTPVRKFEPTATQKDARAHEAAVRKSRLSAAGAAAVVVVFVAPTLAWDEQPLPVAAATTAHAISDFMARIGIHTSYQ